MLKPTGSMFVNLGDKYAGSGGHNNANITKRNLPGQGAKASNRAAYLPSTRRNAPDRYVQATEFARPKSLLGLPWRYAIGCIDGLAAPGGQRWILRAEIVWSKPNGLPESVTDRVRRSHEQWFHMVKSPRYFAAVDEVREAYSPHTLVAYPNGPGGKSYTEVVEPGDARSERNDGIQAVRYDAKAAALGKLPGSVWQIPSEPLIIPEAVARHYDLPDHFAAFPQEWPRRIILGWSPSGICVECGEGRRPVVAKNAPRPLNWRERQGLERDGTNGLGGSSLGCSAAEREATITGYACACPDDSAPTTPARVLDPFGGTGTTSMVARTLGRFGISVDLSADYCRLARWRIWESGHGEKAAQRTHKENQGDLFGNAPQVHCVDVAVGEAL